MLVKVLDENRVKILMEDQDIAYYDLPFDKLNDDDPQSQAFIYELIQKTHERTGIDFHECRVLIEVIPGVDESYYILLTRIKEKGDEKFQIDKAEIAEREMYIFKLEQARDVLRFFEILKDTPPENSVLYYFNEFYYALVSFSPSILSETIFQQTLLNAEEFGKRCQYRFINDAILSEWGECLCKRRAFETLISERSLALEREL